MIQIQYNPSLLHSETLTNGLIFWICLYRQPVYLILTFSDLTELTDLTKSSMCFKLIECHIKSIEIVVFIGQNGEILVILYSQT